MVEGLRVGMTRAEINAMRGPDGHKIMVESCPGSYDAEHNGTTTKRIASSLLTKDQLAVATRVLNGDSIFLTGPAGSGKSFLFRYIIQELKKKFDQKGDIAVTAPTGIAAVNVNGQTIHSWAGVGLAREDVGTLCMKVEKSRTAQPRWRKVKVLLIDEISMLDSDLFHKLSEVGKHVRRNMGGVNAALPFGGVQIVCCGDFFQLPPVALSFGKTFCFNTKEWHDLDLSPCKLTQVIRQSGDPLFTQVLNEIRIGHLSPTAMNLLRDCHVSRKALPKDGILPTKLYCTNKDVNWENDQRLRELPGVYTYFEATDKIFREPDTAPQYMYKAKQSLKEMADKKVQPRLSLKIGAQVVLLRNLDDTLVNGSRGVVVGYKTYSEPDYDLSSTVKSAAEQEVEVNAMVAAAPDGFATVFPNPNEPLLYSMRQNTEELAAAMKKVATERTNFENELSTSTAEESSSQDEQRQRVVCYAYLESLMHAMLQQKDTEEEQQQQRRVAHERMLAKRRRRQKDQGNPVVRFDNGRSMTINRVAFTCSFGTKGGLERLAIPLRLGKNIGCHIDGWIDGWTIGCDNVSLFWKLIYFFMFCFFSLGIDDS
jgi:hypothetical protein